jgi:4-amino-4-deoxy-L-arabinose transferase-like glycosyltransferase
MRRYAPEKLDLLLFAFAAAIFLICILSPPRLMDDVDAVQAQIARNMLASGDWVTARLDGVAYLEKAPLIYWLMAFSFRVFGVHDWAARVPIGLSAILLCLVTQRFARWALGREAGFYSGLCLATSIGLFLFTRILIPDVALTLTITAALFAFLRALDEDERNPRKCAYVFWVCLALGMLLKGLIALVFPIGAAAIFLGIQGELWRKDVYRKLQLVPGLLLFLLIAAPWHVAAMLANPPYFDFTMHSEAGAYHGFFWFYFLNEHLFRFLNIRYPRDYNTVPRLAFWLLQLLWLFPWSVFFPATVQLRYRGTDRGSRLRLLALCWAGFVMLFFTFSTTQEYYSMPCYPAFAILIGSAMASRSRWLRLGTQAAAAFATVAACVLAFLFWSTRNIPTPGDISVALSQNPDVYTLSMGHVFDLTFKAFAYLRLPLALAAAATIVGALGAWRGRTRTAFVSLAVMMVIFYQAARLALTVFDPYLGSFPLAEALLHAPSGQLIVDDQYYAFSSVIFYTNRRALLLNGRKMNLEYGSYAPGAPEVFIDDTGFARLWNTTQRFYLLADATALPRLNHLVQPNQLHIYAASGGKYLITNMPAGAGS